jgi:pimeloyl-ACP methyl ester carboxylesterase
VPLHAGMQDALLIYLHGFASSAGSGKATYFRQRLKERGHALRAPDLNLPDFSTLTVSRMLEQTRALLDPARPAILIGSSLGGFVAVNAGAAWPSLVKGIVLMAPALDFSDQGLSGPGGADVAAWRRAGHLNVFHFGYGRMMPVHYELYADARRYDALHANLPMPVLVFQGRRDTAVDPATVEAWSRARPNVELHMLDDDHQLAASLPRMWARIAVFIDNPRVESPATFEPGPSV